MFLSCLEEWSGTLSCSVFSLLQNVLVSSMLLKILEFGYKTGHLLASCLYSWATSFCFRFWVEEADCFSTIPSLSMTRFFSKTPKSSVFQTLDFHFYEHWSHAFLFRLIPEFKWSLSWKPWIPTVCFFGPWPLKLKSHCSYDYKMPKYHYVLTLKRLYLRLERMLWFWCDFF